TLSLQMVKGISQTAPLSVASLDAFSETAGVALTNAGNDVDTLAGQAQGGVFSYTDANSVTVGAADFDTGVQTDNANISLTADSLALSKAVNAGTGVVILKPLTTGLTIDLGVSAVPGLFGLSDADLGQVTAGALRIGSGSAGDINVIAPITAHAGYATLSLSSGGAGRGIVAGPPAATNPAPHAARGRQRPRPHPRAP